MACENCKSKKKNRVNVCVKCGSDNVVIGNCGYSSFNAGSGECKNCGNEAIASNGPWDNDNWIVSEWNYQNPTREEEIERLAIQIDDLKKRIKEVLERKW